MKSIAPDLRNYETFSLYDFLKEKNNFEISSSVNEVFFEKQTYIYQPPFNGNYVYEIISGSVKLGGYSDKGEEYIYDVLSKGDFFGNFMYLNGQFAEFSKAIVDVELRLYELSFFKMEVKKYPVSAEWFFSYLTKRWYLTEKKLCKVNDSCVLGKLNFLEEVYQTNFMDARGKIYNVYNLLTQKDKGDLVGATRQTIASALKSKLL
ncbi:Crp/Fnr family transcriptional regulator [Flavobacterium faecale]|uniref:Crp/Fnr family transcriptional regulator n=1 Tax=Flavobacterium faecale TaxID=1355330 RepID=A0A2S1LE41_9FLAO|nr:Crp/Fnr family transcriptional regulator [Flavobacterium faecale]AWG22042.1 Crp/Fnr family transcriptional regulator [Flavobacterium faecale]